MPGTMPERVVVTGGGIVSSLGESWEQVKTHLQQCQNRIVYMTEWDKYSELNTRLASPIHDFALPSHYTKREMRSMGRVAKLGVRATELAIVHSGLSADMLQDGRTGVSYGSATGSSDAAMEFFSLLENHSMERLNSTTYLRMMSHSAAVSISIHFQTTGRMYTTSTACTAGSQAIGYAYEAIRSGYQQVMLAGGAEELCPTQAAVFDVVYATSTRNVNPAQSPRPFDKDRDGLVIGEGACTLVLESLSHARQRGATILAEIVGYATNTDGLHIVKPRLATMQKVMQQALHHAQLDPEAVGYISAHGTATEHGDIAESHATAAVMGTAIPTSSLKSYIGHSLGACGAIEAWLSIQMMREGWFSPTLNLETPDPDCAPLNYIRNGIQEINTDYVMSNNFAFGGVNTSLILKRFVE
jgi:3-oxoacyl-[acyl-carrier-protein] synthase II